MLGIYKYPIQNKTEFLQQLSSVLAFHYPRKRENIIIGNLNTKVENHHFSDFM